MSRFDSCFVSKLKVRTGTITVTEAVTMPSEKGQPRKERGSLDLPQCRGKG